MKVNLLMKYLKVFENFTDNEIFSAEYVTDQIWNLLDHSYYENDWDWNDYYKTIKRFGKKWKFIEIDPNELKFNEDFDEDMVEEYEDNIENGIELKPIVVDSKNEIIDGNHRAQASLRQGVSIMAYKSIKDEKIK